MIFEGAYGEANIEHGVPLTPQTVFSIGSTSKQFTAACILRLSYQGLLELDDQASEYLPEIKILDRGITLRHLLHHTSGLRDFYGLGGLAGWRKYDYATERVLRLLERQRDLNFDPGERFLYSSTNYLVLAKIAERVVGKSLAAVAEELLFGPLSMRNSLYREDSSVPLFNRAAGHLPRPDGGWALEEPWANIMGPGGVHTSLGDLVAWERNFVQSGEESTDLFEQMATPARTEDGSEIDYGIGLMIGSYKGLRTVSHAGGGAGFSADIVRFPSPGLTVICLANIGGFAPTQKAYQVADLVLESARPSKSMPLTPDEGRREEEMESRPSLEDFEEHLGAYLSPGKEMLARLIREGDKLLMVAPGQSYEMRAAGPRRLRSVSAVDLELTFERDSRNDRAIHVRAGTEDQGMWRRVELPDLNEEDVGEYEGAFYSEELDVEFTVRRKETGLQLVGTTKAADMQPIDRDAFLAESLVIRFTRETKGQINGLEIDAGRVLGVRFTPRVETGNGRQAAE